LWRTCKTRHFYLYEFIEEKIMSEMALYKQQRTLGKTGLKVPALSLGGVGIGGMYGDVLERDAIDTVQLAFDREMRYIDTSPLYLESERRIGMALEGVSRDSYVLSTKTGTHPRRWQDYSRDATLWSVENSLKLLKTDYIDLLLVHDPETMEPVYATGGALDALDELRQQKVIGHIGLGQRNLEFHKQAIESGRIDVILTFNDYHPVRTIANDDILPRAQDNNIGVLNGSPLAHGFLAVEDPHDLPKYLEARRNHLTEADWAQLIKVFVFCRRQKISTVAFALQFCLRQPRIHCTLTGVKTPDELKANLEATESPLPESLWEAWDREK
jgi:aryl-alcohol dehydrogenase-like predicted oxidoreductase